MEDERETWVIVGEVLEGEWLIWSARRKIRRLAHREGNTPAATRIDIRHDSDGCAIPVPVGGGTGTGGE